VRPGQVLYDSRRIASNNDIWGDIFDDDSFSSYDRSIANRHTLQNASASSNPDLIANDDRLDSVGIDGLIGTSCFCIRRMSVEIRKADTPREQAARSDCDRLSDHQFTLMSDKRVVTDNQLRNFAGPMVKNDLRFSRQVDVASDNDPTTSFQIWQPIHPKALTYDTALASEQRLVPQEPARKGKALAHRYVHAITQGEDRLRHGADGDMRTEHGQRNFLETSPESAFSPAEPNREGCR
jgi:hypothetical protein